MTSFQFETIKIYEMKQEKNKIGEEEEEEENNG
jgi:hypothetical protein